MVLALAVAGACTRPAATSRPAAKVVIEVIASPPDAEIWVDGRYVATVAEAVGGLRVPVGVHEVEITREGYYPYLVVVDVVEAAAPPPRIEATLFPVVREPPRP
ncbi:MAG: PEGA domain-containing protein [Myxococcales bacterium]|nr:PEGA domain-containing protein [Myxococcales bacterium]